MRLFTWIFDAVFFFIAYDFPLSLFLYHPTKFYFLLVYFI